MELQINRVRINRARPVKTNSHFLILLPPTNVVCKGYVITGLCLSMGGGVVSQPTCLTDLWGGRMGLVSQRALQVSRPTPRGAGMQKSSTKNSQVNGSLRENISIFWLHLLDLISRRNVGMRGHLRKGIVLLKYQYFRFRTKAGAHFECLNWLEKSTKAFDVGGL